ncbi:hypothetical protein Roomu2_00081 [Pseudomonas phage vB_PpuM-Roomu-2]|uniref:Holin n=2 Tax=Tartuvirus TaxID=3424912 RepID=A0AAX4N0E1_9CAUD
MFLALIVYITMVVLPAIKAAGILAMALVVSITAAVGATWGMPYEKDAQERGRLRFNAWLKGGWLKVLVVVVLIGAFTPNEKVTWYIVGAYAAEKVATADATKQLAGETYEMFRDLLKKARENINETDAAKLKEKAEAAIDKAEKAFDNANKTADNTKQQVDKQGEKK